MKIAIQLAVYLIVSLCLVACHGKNHSQALPHTNAQCTGKERCFEESEPRVISNITFHEYCEAFVSGKKEAKSFAEYVKKCHEAGDRNTGFPCYSPLGELWLLKNFQNDIKRLKMCAAFQVSIFGIPFMSDEQGDIERQGNNLSDGKAYIAFKKWHDDSPLILRNNKALAYGDYNTLFQDNSLWAFLKTAKDSGDIAVIIANSQESLNTAIFDVPKMVSSKMFINPETRRKVTASRGKLAIEVPPLSVIILVPAQ